MSKAADSIRKGLEQAVAYAKGDTSPRAYRVHVPAHVDAKAIRTKLGMTQQAFAARFGFSVNTLRHWEQGKRVPEGPTRAYLLVIERAPRVVEKALRSAWRRVLRRTGAVGITPTPKAADSSGRLREVRPDPTPPATR
jgi:putative transcriptional regulator